MKNLRFIWNYIRKYKWLYIAGIATLFVVDYSSLFIPKITGEIADGLSGSSFTMRDVCFSLCKLLLFGLIMTVGRVGWRFFFMGTSRDIERDIRNDFFSHLCHMDVGFYKEFTTGDLMSRFTNDLNCIRQAIGPAVISLFDGTVMTIMVLCQMLFYVDIRLTILTMIPMVLIAFGVVIYGRIIHRLFNERQEALSELTDFSRESFTGIRVIKSFVREKYRIYMFTKQNKNTRDKTLKANNMMALMMPLLDLIIEMSILIALIYGGILTIRGSISLGRFIAFNQYIIMLIWPMIACGDAVNSFSQGAASIKRIREIMETEPGLVDGPMVTDEEITDYSIHIRNLSFNYPLRKDAGVNDISLDVSSGTCLGITGRTGCGKTTLAELLLHIYHIPDETIFIGNRDINTIPINYLRNIIAAVPQDDFLFSDTIRNNILFGNTGASDKDVIESAQLSCVHDNICGFADGYDTWVGERGVTLSGGQKQRICIARALLRNAPILILDDAMSAVDTDTERRLVNNIFSVRKDKTTIIIAHRITTISRAGKIIVMDNGRIIQTGSHEDMINCEGAYKDLYLRQQLEDEYRGVLG